MNLSTKPFAFEPLHGLYPFQLENDAKHSGWFCFTLSVARALRVTARAVAQLVSRHASSLPTTTIVSVSRTDSPGSFPRVLATYVAVRQQLEGAVESLNSRKGDKFNVYPLPLVAKLLALHSPSKVDSVTLTAVQAFVEEKKLAHAPDPASSSSPSALAGMGLEMAAPAHEAAPAAAEAKKTDTEVKVKREPASASSLPVSSYAGGIPVIDLTNPRTLAALGRLEDAEQAEDVDVEQTLSSLVDNFALWNPVMEEYKVLREYSMRPDEVSPLLQEQCQRFSEYRQEIWNWHRDPSQVTPRTVGNNIRVFLLFGGFVCHSTKRHRLKPAVFDMSVFGSKHIDAYITDFLHYLHGSRQLMFSSIANYLNSLVVLAKFYFVDNPLADVSFSADRVDSDFVLAGLRRVRAQTNAKAKSEAVQKPLHAQWLSWAECQDVRRACQAAYIKKQQVSVKAALRVLKSLVCLMFYTIAPPPRCSIVRLLQWRTTLVKKRTDPTRYVIDLLNNPEAPASQHKTVKLYRLAILPLPKSLTAYLDALRKHRKSDWVFVNSRGQPYSTSSWTHFVKSTFAKYSGDRKKAPSASLARSIFVTWLNGVPYDKRDSSFLEEMKLSAAEYQTHSLAIANSHYDKDAASEAKLRVLVDFCDAYSQWQPADQKTGAATSAALSGAGLSDNIDSDEDEEEGGPARSALAQTVGEEAGTAALSAAAAPAKDPSALHESAAAAAPVAPETKTERPAKRKARRGTKRPASDDEASSGSDSDSDSDSDSSSSIDDAGQDDDAEYLPDRIIAKKTVDWRDFYLIHWLGYSAAERTWEPAAFFDQWCTKQTYEYEQSRHPQRILALTTRPQPSGERKAERKAERYFEVQWQGRSETSMEREQLMRERYPEVVQEWENREQVRASRKQLRRDDSAPLEGEPPYKQARLS